MSDIIQPKCHKWKSYTGYHFCIISFNFQKNDIIWPDSNVSVSLSFFFFYVLSSVVVAITFAFLWSRDHCFPADRIRSKMGTTIYAIKFDSFIVCIMSIYGHPKTALYNGLTPAGCVCLCV